LLLALQAERVQHNPSVDTALRTALLESRVRREASVGHPVLRRSIGVGGDGQLVVATRAGLTELDGDLRRVARLPALGRFLGARGNELMLLTPRGLELRGFDGRRH